MSQFYPQYNNSKLNVKDEWGTPDWIYWRLNLVFGFTVDAAASRENRKNRYYWTIDDDGLNQSWVNQVVFCNPPFTKGGYKPWIAKAKREHVINRVESVMVLPFKSTTRAFRPVFSYAKYLIIPYRRIKFTVPDNVKLKGSGAPTFESCIVAFTYRELTTENVKILSRIGRVINLHLGYIRV